MNNALLIALISVAGPPAFGLLTAILGSYIGKSAKARDVESQLKRVQLVEGMKKLQQAGFPNHDWSILDQEVAELLAFLEQTSVAGTARSDLVTRPRSRLLGRVILPRPRTVIGWIATIVYYLYGVATLGYVVLGIQVSLGLGAGVDPEIKSLIIPMIFGAGTLVLGSRWVALRSAKRSQERATRVSGTGSAA